MGKQRMVNAARRWLSTILPYRPMDGGKESLDVEYSSGAWDYLRELEELSRFSVVAGYCHHLKNRGSILEIGCGDGILQERLDRSRFSRYVGVDISAAAIKRASGRQDEKVLFVAADASSYTPDETFDVVIFNECLEYFNEPLKLVRRYEPYLKKDGIFIVSMFVGIETARTRRIWKVLGSVYAAKSETRVSNEKKYSWVVKILVPSGEKSDSVCH